MTYDDDYWTNVSSDPEKYGLEIVGSLDDPDACYSFNILLVWQHADGRLFYATDSGCSCPSPFEGYKSLDDLYEITDESWTEFQKAVTGHCVPQEYDYETSTYIDLPDPQAADKTDLLAKVARLLPRSTA